jgi:hypothetical protein
MAIIKIESGIFVYILKLWESKTVMLLQFVKTSKGYLKEVAVDICLFTKRKGINLFKIIWLMVSEV